MPPKPPRPHRPKVKVTVSHKVKAGPAKAFFVGMITRDIELQDAILDLLDNCVDGIRRTVRADGALPYKGYRAEIAFDEHGFVIEDNCGGIPLHIAQEYAFMMGRPAKQKDSASGTIGVYGIGMKRAIFKMGKSCVVHSHTKKNTFDVEITKEWMEDDGKWTLEARDTKAVIKEFGTRITVRDLHRVVREEFTEGSDFRNKFPGVVRAAYSFLLEKGFSVKINGKPLTPRLPTLLWDDSEQREVIRPYLYTAEIDGVKIFLSVGFRDRPETSPGDDANSEPRYSSEDAGWTVVCNDRVVLAFDKTKQTGWGWGGVPSYHTQFIAISGFVIFEGDPVRLPMTTTKRGVDANSPIYTVVREKMQEGLLKFTKFTNDWKGHDPDPVFENAAPKPIPEIMHKAVSGQIKLSTLRGEGNQRQSVTVLPERPKEVTMRRISFLKPVREIRRLSSHFFETPDASPSDVGIQCFDYIRDRLR